MLDSNEQFILSTIPEFRNRVEMVGIRVAGAVREDDISQLIGGMDEHTKRWKLSMKTFSASEELIEIASKGVAIALRDFLTLPDKEGDRDDLIARVNRMQKEITDEAIEQAMMTNWSMIAGYDPLSNSNGL